MKSAAPLFALAFLLAACGRVSVPDAGLGNREKCSAYSGLPAGWGADAHAGMVQVASGRFMFGSTRGYTDEGPEQPADVNGFWIDRTEVTNAQFDAFVRATGYVTEAERGGGAAVFRAPDVNAPMTPGSWWQLDAHADWRHPEGAASGIAQRMHEPVVDVTYADAQAYARWLHHALPSEVQWEYAARAGRSNEISDAAVRDADGRPLANFWQGVFPLQDRADDGYAGRAPVGCYPDNGWRLYDMVGNVWEWTTDADGAHRIAPTLETAALTRHGQAQRYVIKGGSWLCSADYCARARASSRQAQEADLGATHLGFRTIASD
ncbi:MAG TPA: formylglycine-generating enzyme family protein [Nevskiaceae bacterium]|nr:formylglycine-generating enzyme family protein [Nevskiaceae bacterium]